MFPSLLPRCRVGLLFVSLVCDVAISLSCYKLSSACSQLHSPHIKHHAGNEFFLIATGLSEREAKRTTIFSIVQSSQLSNLYKMVARALAEKRSVPRVTSGSSSTSPTTLSSSEQPSSSSSATASSSAASTKSDQTDNNEEWQAITLECVAFNDDSKKSKQKSSSASPHPLYITVSLMEDENRDQRCFHCILTDCPGTNGGKLGSVTPELFAMLHNAFCPTEKGWIRSNGVE